MPDLPTAYRVLVLGRAKTGTTVISKTIQHSIPRARCFLEPKQLSFFENAAWAEEQQRVVVKLIVEHWNAFPEERELIIQNGCALKFSHKVAIVRDPRDEIISRLYYYLLPYVRRAGYDRNQVDAWLAVLREKECNPSAMPVIEMIRRLASITGEPVSSVPAEIGRIGEYFQLLERWRHLVHVVRYEDFMSGHSSALEAYLGFALSQDRSVEGFEWTRRSMTVDNWKQMFTAEDVEFYRNALAESMGRCGYTDWKLETPPKLDASTGSDYVEALIASEI